MLKATIKAPFSARVIYTQTTEQARNEVFRILEKPRQAKAFWGQFKRSVVNVSESVERDRALGVSSPNTPVWSRERIEPSVEEAAAAGQKIIVVNGNGTTKPVIEGVRTPQLDSCKPIKRSGKEYQQCWYHYEEWRNGDRSLQIEQFRSYLHKSVRVKTENQKIND